MPITGSLTQQGRRIRIIEYIETPIIPLARGHVGLLTGGDSIKTSDINMIRHPDTEKDSKSNFQKNL